MPRDHSKFLEAAAKAAAANRLPERNKQLYKMHMDGVEDSTIARHFGLTKQRVHTIIREAGLKTRRDMTTEVRDGIAEHIRNGYTAKEIAALFGVSYIYVLKVTHQLGLKTNRHTRAEQAKIDDLIKLAEKGMSIYSMTKGDRKMREKAYREAKERGIVFDTYQAHMQQEEVAPAKKRRNAVRKRIIAGG